MRDNSIHGHHQMVNTKNRLIVFFAGEDGETLYSHQKQGWKLTVAQIMNFLLCNSDKIKLNKIGKTTRPFRYELNQTPSDYTVEATNRFKGLDLIDRVPEELRTEDQDAVIKTILKEKKKRQNGCPRKPYK